MRLRCFARLRGFSGSRLQVRVVLQVRPYHETDNHGSDELNHQEEEQRPQTVLAEIQQEQIDRASYGGWTNEHPALPCVS